MLQRLILSGQDLKYISTRGQAPTLTFTEALLAGLAPDGGLYVPEHWPSLDAATIAGFAGQSYAQVAEAVIAPFVGDAIARSDLRAMIEDAYKGFRHTAIAPLAQIESNLFVLELFHGPTLAFKDVAMQLLGRLVNHALRIKGERATIVGATSGDTGAAAIDAFRGQPLVDVFILYPHGRVSDVQRRQMTTLDDANIHALALEGNFDDAQAILKGLFRNEPLRKSLNLTGVNSINWARVVAQIVYFFSAAVALGAPHRPVSFTVPTGNFGDIFAGYVAKRMGLPIDRLVIATNENDILTRTLATGRYDVQGVHATSSPSMDIQVSSNFERLLFDAHGRDAATIRGLMASLDQSRGFALNDGPLAAIRAEFDAFAIDEDSTRNEIARTWQECEMMLDPHTAVGVAAARKAVADNPNVPMIVAGTAHPAKFPDAIIRAIGVHPPLPKHMQGIMERPERFEIIANDLQAVAQHVQKHARIGAAS